MATAARGINRPAGQFTFFAKLNALFGDTNALFGDTILISGRFRCFALWPSFLQRELALEKLLLLRDPFVGRQWPPSPQLRLDRLGQRLACRVG